MVEATSGLQTLNGSTLADLSLLIGPNWITSGLPTHQEKQNLPNDCNRGLSPISEGLHFFEAASFSSMAFRQASCSPRHGAGKPIARA